MELRLESAPEYNPLASIFSHCQFLHLRLAISDRKTGTKLFAPLALPCQVKNSLTLGCPQAVGGFVSADIAGNALAGREGGAKHCRAEIDSKFHATPPFIKRGAS